jgi:two-component system response regulator NreC
VTIRIILADDHKITREGLINMLESKPDMEVIAEAKNGREAVELARELRPDVVVMDVTMPDLNGIDATRKIIRNSRYVKVIGLSMHSDKRFVRGMIEAGASGYLLKDCAFEELVRAIQAVVYDQAYLSPGIVTVMLTELFHQRSGKDDPDPSRLTCREREILQLIAEGFSTREIGRRLGVSIKTVETHRRQVMEKAGARSIAGLTKFAIKEGLTTL